MGKQKWSVLAIVLSSAVAAAAPPKGAYKIVKWIDGKEVSTPDDIFKKNHARGEVVVTFDDGQLSVGLWEISKETDDKKPGVTYIGTCRGEATGSVKWTGDTLTLDAPIAFRAFSDEYVYTPTKKGKKGDADVFHHTMSCTYKMSAPSYKVSGTGDKITLTTPDGNQTILARTTPIADVDPRPAADKLSDE